MIDLTNPIFSDANKAREYLESVRWADGPYCPHCGEVENIRALKGKSHRPGLRQCNSCRQQFTVTVGTVFERSKIPLNKWLAAFFLMTSSKKGISAHQIHRMLGITYKSAWFMCHRIREAMRDDSGGPLGGTGRVIEADESQSGINGVYHAVSEQHLQRYLAEFDFRYSNRAKLGVDDTERAERAIKCAAGKRLTYRRTDEAAHA